MFYLMVLILTVSSISFAMQINHFILKPVQSNFIYKGLYQLQQANVLHSIDTKTRLRQYKIQLTVNSKMHKIWPNNTNNKK